MTLEATWTMEGQAQTLWRSLYYGRYGTEKTTRAAGWPKPLLVDFEAGYTVLKSRGINIARIVPQSTNDVERIVMDFAGVTKDLDIETVIFDTLTSMQDVFMEDILKVPRNRGKTPKEPSLEDYRSLAAVMKGFFRLANKLPVNVVYICHEEISFDEDTGKTEGWPMLVGKLKQSAGVLTDMVLYFAKQGSKVKVYSDAQGRFGAKSRLKLPSIMEDFSYEKYIAPAIEALSGAVTKEASQPIGEKNAK